jgi:outer membrane biosynthesis protein TonB
MRDWRGPIVLVLAVGVAVTLVTGVVGAEFTPGKVTPEESTFFSTLGGAIVGAVATYLGVQHKEGSSKMSQTETVPERDEPVEPQPVPEPQQPEPEQPDERPSEPTEPDPQPNPEPDEENLACPPETRTEPREGQPWGLTDHEAEGDAT